MKLNIVARNRQFFGGAFLLMVAMIVLLIFYSKADSFILLNAYHSRALDYFFMYYTNVGDGLFSLGIAVIFLSYKRFLIGFEIIAAFLLSGALVQLLKYFLPMPRPSVFLANGHYNHFIENVTLTGHASFPSGHSASVFALATILSLSDKNKNRSYLYLLLAVLVAYSRIYLGQHFLQDVFWGSTDGFISAMVIWAAAARWRIKKEEGPAQ
jgi:membrane-associated phospholipid phosphatase